MEILTLMVVALITAVLTPVVTVLLFYAALKFHRYLKLRVRIRALRLEKLLRELQC